MGRTPVDGVARDVMVNFKLKEEENDQLVELVKATGTSKSAIIRKAIGMIFAKAAEARKRAAVITREMIKDGKFDFEHINAMNKIFADELENELNNMAHKEVVKTVKKKKSSFESTEDK
jgi:predicted DNA-binding protein